MIERRHMFDVVTEHEASLRVKISYIVLLWSEHSVADALTKLKKDLVLERLLGDGKIDHPIEELVLDRDLGRSRDREDGHGRSTSL